MTGLLPEGRFLARAKRGSILEALDEIRIAKGFDLAECPNVNELLEVAEDRLLNAVAIIEEAGS